MKKIKIIGTTLIIVIIFIACKNRSARIHGQFEYSDEYEKTTQNLRIEDVSERKNQSYQNQSYQKVPVSQHFKDQNIMGRGNVSVNSMTNFFRKTNPQMSTKTVKQFAEIYISEANIEGVNYEVAWIQMCLETNFLRFGGQVDAKQNNFCGLGALDGGAKGEVFATPRLGVRAQIQHLKAYASTKPLMLKCIDPRFSLVKPRGCAPKISYLTKRWASDKDYHLKLSKFLQEMRAM